MVDTYTKAVLTVIAVGLLVLAGRPLLEPSPAFGQLFKEGETIPSSGEPRSIPKSWGRLVSVVAVGQGSGSPDATYFYFEASDGTIRRAFSNQFWGVLVERGAWLRK
jgi:hypothetical protein